MVFTGATLVSTRPILGHGKHLFPDIDLAVMTLDTADRIAMPLLVALVLEELLLTMIVSLGSNQLQLS